jgi:hypothetical protein
MCLKKTVGEESTSSPGPFTTRCGTIRADEVQDVGMVIGNSTGKILPVSPNGDRAKREQCHDRL